MRFEQMSREELLQQLQALEKEKAEQNDRDRERDKDALLQDLRVHQVELELQNRELRETHSALEQSRSRFEELYDFAPVAYYTLDVQACVKEVNLTGASMVGRDRARLIGLPFLSLVTMPDSSTLWSHLRRCGDGRQPVVSVVQFSTERLGLRTFQVVSAPVLDASRKVVAFRTSFTDISELKKLETELQDALGREALLRKRFETLDRISWSLSQRLARDGGTPPDEILQEIVDHARTACDAEYAALGIGEDPTRPFSPWIFSGLPPELAKALGRFPGPTGLLGEVIREGRSIRLRDLREHPKFRGFPPHHPEMRSFLGVAVPDGGRPVGHLYLTNKLTDEEFTQDDQDTIEMLAQRAGMAYEIARLTRETREAVTARDNLLAIVSHDLRSPLSAIHFGADLLTAQSPPEDRRQNRKQIDLIARSARQMNRLIGDLLQAATIEVGKFTVEPRREEVLPLVEEALQVLDPMAKAKSVQLRPDVSPGLPRILGDRARIIQVLFNLVGNALRFSPEGGTILIRAWAHASSIHFAVSDHGPGIAEDQLAHLFDRYWKGKAEARHGFGLGLFIAKGIVEAHGGQIWVESQPNVGSTFFFTIPIASEIEPLASSTSRGAT